MVPGANVKLAGSTSPETQTDQNGEYELSAVPYGAYTVEAASTGFNAVQIIRVEAHELQLDLELKPAEVRTSVVVTADQPDSKGPAPSETISDKTLRDAPSANERFESSLPLVPGVVRGPDGHVNLKGTRNTQSGALVNSANVTDPVTGSPAINLPVDVVSSVQVISNPYDPKYGRFTGAVSKVETKISNYETFHLSFQNFLPRLRDRDGSIRGIGSATPRITLTGPLLKDRIAITQSFEYRFVQTPVNSLPPFQRDTKLESFDSYTQLDFTVSSKQTANVSLSFYPQRLSYLGLNTFNTQSSTPDFHQRGYQLNVQDSYLIGSGLLSSQLTYKRFNADITAQSDDPYRLAGKLFFCSLEIRWFPSVQRRAELRALFVRRPADILACRTRRNLQFACGANHFHGPNIFPSFRKRDCLVCGRPMDDQSSIDTGYWCAIRL